MADNQNIPKRGRRMRKRLRGALDSKTGRSVGLASLAAPLAGLIVEDLRRKDSVIKGLIGTGVKKLIEARRAKRIEAVDITDKVEVVTDKSGD